MIKAAEGHIKVRRKQHIPTLKELVAQIAPENRFEEIPTGPTQGKESVDSQLHVPNGTARFLLDYALLNQIT
jgi:hypothetical protein